ncbi:hypothetical protein GGF46_004524 [Coemansia sp. RSA 552]|nr:hypothetical protein GGF46_004524 [Coemansia sp. RSA 552]
MNTVYNLLTELGDLNRTNRRAAEELAAKFSVLQARVSQDGSSESMRIGTPVPGESSPGESYHTPIMEERVHVFPGVLPIRSPSVARGERGVQTDMGAGDIAMVELRLEEVEGENRGLREDVRRLVGAVREQQQMAGEYEGVLAKALGALRAAAFERHVEIGDVQVRYRELLDSEKSLNTRLAKENIELKVALGSAARLIRTSLAEEDVGGGGVPPVDT